MEQRDRVRVRVRGKRKSRGVERSECVPGKVEVASVQGGCCDVVLVGAEILWGQRAGLVSESGEVGGNIWSASKADSGRTCQPRTCLHAPPRIAGRMGRVLADDSYTNAL